MKEHAGWNGTKPLATVALGVNNEGDITSTTLHLVGVTQDKLVDGRFLWEDCREGCHVKVKSFDLSTLTFRGSLASEFVPASAFPWTFRIPSKSKKDYYHEVDRVADMTKYGADTSLWLRVLAQPWLGGCLKISAGLASIDDIGQLPDHINPRCPLVEVFSTVIPLHPRPDQDIPIPFVPYILDQRADRTGDIVHPTSDAVFSSVIGMLKNQVKPNLKRGLWAKARSEDWNVGEPSRYTTTDRVPAAEEDSADEDNLGEQLRQ